MARPISEIIKNIKPTDDLVPFPETFADQLSEILQGGEQPITSRAEFISASGLIMVVRQDPDDAECRQ